MSCFMSPTIREVIGYQCCFLFHFISCTVLMLWRCFTAWFGSNYAQDQDNYRELIADAAQSNTQTRLSTIYSIYASCCHGKAVNIITDLR